MEDRIKFYRTPVDKELFKKLRERSNFHGLVQSLGILIFYTLTTMVSLFFFSKQMWIAMVFAVYFHSIFSNFLGMESSVHELSHKTPFKTKWLNEIFYYLFCFLTWNNPIHFRESHRRHHQFTLFQGKDKEVIIKPAPFSTLDYISWFLFDWKKFKMIMFGNLALILGKDSPDIFFWDPLFEKHDPRRAKMIRFARLQLSGHILLIALFVYFQLWVLIYIVSLSYFFVTFLSRSCEIVQHVGLQSNIPDYRISCHTMKFNRIMSFFYWNMNYHIEHHMFAAVPFHNLPGLHNAIVYDQPEPVTGYLKGVNKILRLIRKQRTDPQWVYIPELQNRSESSGIE